LEEAAWEVGVVLTLLEEGQAPRAFLKEARLLKGGEVGEEGRPSRRERVTRPKQQAKHPARQEGTMPFLSR
jgi:hypothetical protein